MQIKELKLFTPNIAALHHFYAEIMGLPSLLNTATNIRFQIGNSVLFFEERPNATPYHFAINIPSYQEEAALYWLKERVDILDYKNQEIQDFSDWNARALYFYDPDKNIVELIARKNLTYPSVATFDHHAWLEISEIGMPVSDIATVYQVLEQQLDIKIFDGGFERFCAIGDEQGLFICINKQVRDWFPKGDPAFSSDFELQLEQAGQLFNLQFKDEKVSIRD